VNEIERFLARFRSRLLRERALVWGARGAALGALTALAFEIATRRWPVDPTWPALGICALAGLVLGIAGWVRSLPSGTEVALAADRSLGGRERLVTALEFAAVSGSLHARQREDTAAFARRADLAALGPPPVPGRLLAATAAALLVAALLAVLPNSALQHLRDQRAAVAARDQAAAAVDSLASGSATARPGEDPAARRQLTETLERAAQEVRRAPDSPSAVAALSQAQQSISELRDPGLPGRRDAASGAGARLSTSSNVDARAAGQALAGGDLKGAQARLGSLADSLPGLDNASRQALASSLSQAAGAAAGDPSLQRSLEDASNALGGGDTGGAAEALRRAAAETGSLDASSAFEGDANQASNGLQRAKESLAGPRAGQGQAGQGGTPGQGNPGSPDQGQAAGQGRTAGQAPGEGSQGAAGPAAGGGGPSGTPGARPPGASEPVYVPPQGADDQGGTPDGSGQGERNGMVPYQQVLTRYQNQALDEVSRSAVPDQERQLVQRYFSDLGGT
jgi:hypothetical protein